MAAGAPEDAIPILKKLAERHDNVIQYRTSLAQAQMQAGQQDVALETFAHAYSLFPRNVPLTMHYAEALVRANQPRRANLIIRIGCSLKEPPSPSKGEGWGRGFDETLSGLRCSG